MAKLAKRDRAYRIGLTVWIALSIPVALVGGLEESWLRLAWGIASGGLGGLSVTLLLMRHDQRWGVPVACWIGHWLALGLVTWGVIYWYAGPQGHYQGLETAFRSVGLMALGVLALVMSWVMDFGWRFLQRRREARLSAAGACVKENQR
jgi:hypothetical protein